MRIRLQVRVFICARLDGMLMIRLGLANLHARMLPLAIFYKYKEDVCLNVQHHTLPLLPKESAYKIVEQVCTEIKLVVNAEHVLTLV